MNKNKIKILDTTLRDGSYAVDSSFSSDDISSIALALEQSNIDMIEIGHGIGLNGSVKENDNQCLEWEYLAAAQKTLKKTPYGVFCIPGVASLADIKKAVDCGISFIRIGTNISELLEAKSYFAEAKKYGLMVFSNLMKSYAVSADEFAKKAKMAEEFGADVVVLVDSAGCFLPKDITEYISKAKKEVSISIGFHGHNNLGLVHANTLKAVEAGVDYIDTSLKGLGRSAGNAATEIMCLILEKSGYMHNVDEFMVMDIAEKYINPLLHNLKNSPLSLVCGFADFHSSFLNEILDVSKKYSIDARDLMIEVSKKDKISPSGELIKDTAIEIMNNKIIKRTNLDVDVKFIASSGKNKVEKLNSILKELVLMSKKRGLFSVFNIVVSGKHKLDNRISDFIYTDKSLVVASMEVSEIDFISDLMSTIDGSVDYVFQDVSVKNTLDQELISFVQENISKSQLLLYDDVKVWAESIIDSVMKHIEKNPNVSIVLTDSDNKLSLYIATMLSALDIAFEVISEITDYSKNVLIISSSRKHVLNKQKLLPFKKLNLVVDSLVFPLDKDTREFLLTSDVAVVRPDMRFALAGEIMRKINSLNTVCGRKTIGDISMVSGGQIGAIGDVVVDSIHNPSMVFGVCKDNGEVNYLLSESEKKKIMSALKKV